MSLPNPDNPFEASADPRRYVPRVKCEEVLDSLERHIRDGVPAILLRGPAGVGKTMLLAVLHERMAESRQIAHVAVSPSPSIELSHRILDQLDVDLEDEPSSALVATARRYAASGRRVLVIIDQATHAPVASSRQLARAAARSRGDLCVLFAVTEEAGAEAFEQEIGAETTDLATVRFDTPMNAEETAEYIARRLDQTIASKALRDRFDEAAFRYVIDCVGGNPRQVNELAYDVLLRLDRGESLPVRYRDLGASAEVDAQRPSPAPEEPRLPPSSLAFDDAFRVEGSLGGGLLAGGPQRDPHEVDAMRELFPPGVLRSGGAPPTPGDAPAPGGTGAPSAPGDARPDVGGAVSAGGDAGPGVVADVARTDGDAGPADRDLELTSVRTESIRPGAVAERAGTGASSKRTKLWVAALVVTAVAGGYLAGRVDRVSTESSALSAAAPEPVVRAPQPMPPEPSPPLVRPDRRRFDALSRPPAVASPTTEALPEPPPVTSSDPGSALPDAELATATRSRVEAPQTEPARPRAAEAVEQVDEPAPLSAQAVAPGTSPDEPERAPAMPSPVPTPAPRVESASVASDANARSQPRSTRARSAGTAADDDAPSTADGSASPILVGARSTAEPGARASAFVRVRVRLEPGATLTIDGARVGVAPISDLIMEPGPHTFVAELADGLQIEQLIQVSADTGIVEF